VTSFATIDRRLYVRDSNTIYLYGGLNGTDYPLAGEQVSTMTTPFMSAEKIATFKMLKGFDAGVVNTWATNILVDPNDETKKLEIGRVHRTSYHEPNIGLPGRTTHIAIEMECSEAGFGEISNLAIHYDAEEAN
jgi:hypothetical protein